MHTHGLALTGTIARALALRVDFGIELRSVLIPDTTAEAIDRVLSFADLTELDALVLVADSPASPLQGEVSIPATVDLLEQLSYRLTPGSSLTWVTGPAAAGVRAQEVQGYLAALRERTSALTRIRMLVKRPPAETAAANYAAWGDAIADTVAGSLIDPLALLPFRAVPTGRAFDVED